MTKVIGTCRQRRGCRHMLIWHDAAALSPPPTPPAHLHAHAHSRAHAHTHAHTHAQRTRAKRLSNRHHGEGTRIQCRHVRRALPCFCHHRVGSGRPPGRAGRDWVTPRRLDGEWHLLEGRAGSPPSFPLPFSFPLPIRFPPDSSPFPATPHPPPPSPP